MKTYLNVPFKEKDRAKALGARFDMSRRQWYCPDGTDLVPLLEWVPMVSKRELDRVRSVLKKQPI